MTKFLTYAVFIILTFSLTGYAQKSAKARAIALAKAKEKEVKAAFDRLVEGIKQVDAEKVMSVYHKGPKTLFFNYNGSATIGASITLAIVSLPPNCAFGLLTALVWFLTATRARSSREYPYVSR